jgi:hypothetical protein
MMKYSAVAPPAIELWRTTVPPSKLPAAGKVKPTWATIHQPGFAARKLARVLLLA